MSNCSIPLSSCDVAPAALHPSAANGADTPFVEIGFASTAFIIVCAALVMIMTPAVGLLYSGLSRSEHALTVVLISCLSYAVVAVQWTVWGFSLSFSEGSGNGFIGNLDYVGLDNIAWQALPLTAAAIPAIVFALYQLQFATVTVSLIFGSVLERVRVLPCIVFMFVWTTLIYDPIAYWNWSARGWIRNMSCLDKIHAGEAPCFVGGLDFAGGGPVHIASGAASLAFCIFLGGRLGTHTEFKHHNVLNVFLGTALLLMGWFGFNGGSALAATPRAGMAAMVTVLAAASGGITWTMVEFALQKKRFSGVAFCSGTIAGLVGITPASGFVNPWVGLIIGAITALCCLIACRLKVRFGYDDTADAWGVHGIGGIVGNLLTGLFAQKSIAALDGTVIPGGLFFDGTGYLLGYNTAGTLAQLAYSFVGTYVILTLINLIPGLEFRLAAKYEIGDETYLADDAEGHLVRKPSERGNNSELPSIFDGTVVHEKTSPEGVKTTAINFVPV